MGKFTGKKLLELGTNNASVDIVKYAKKEGAYVIVTDYYSPDRSEAKKYADRAEEISTIDIDSLAEYVKREKIDGIFCGVSEINLKSALSVANKTGLNCYFTKEQWELCENKAVFKELCRKYNVPVALQYHLSYPPAKEELDKVSYPVIVKPVDLSASRGIHICHDENSLLLGYSDAIEKSPSHNIIIEEFLVGDEISATYTFVNGECRLSMLSQMYHNNEQQGLVPLPDAYIYPSKHLGRFTKEVNSNMIEMLKSTGIQNGSIFVTGIANENGFAFFEAGLRIAGTAPYRFVDHINGINILELMTEYAINGCIEDPSVIEREDPTLKGKICCLYSMLNGGGLISKIEGVEQAEKIPGVLMVTTQRRAGDYIKRDGTLGQVNIRFYIVSDTIDEIRNIIGKIQEIVKVTDENGKNMILNSHILTDLKNGED